MRICPPVTAGYAGYASLLAMPDYLVCLIITKNNIRFTALAQSEDWLR